MSEGLKCEECGTTYHAPLMVPPNVWSRIAGEGDTLCPNCIMARIASAGLAVAVRATTARALGHSTLTDRETDVLAGLLQGLSNKQIGRILSVSHRTVEVHRIRVMAKTGAVNGPDLVMRVIRRATQDRTLNPWFDVNVRRLPLPEQFKEPLPAAAQPEGPAPLEEMRFVCRHCRQVFRTERQREFHEQQFHDAKVAAA